MCSKLREISDEILLSGLFVLNFLSAPPKQMKGIRNVSVAQIPPQTLSVPESAAAIPKQRESMVDTPRGLCWLRDQTSKIKKIKIKPQNDVGNAGRGRVCVVRGSLLGGSILKNMVPSGFVVEGISQARDGGPPFDSRHLTIRFDQRPGAFGGWPAPSAYAFIYVCIRSSFLPSTRKVLRICKHYFSAFSSR